MLLNHIDVMNKLMNMIEELKHIINKIHDMSVNYINNQPIYEKFQNQIEAVNKLKFKIYILVAY